MKKSKIEIRNHLALTAKENITWLWATAKTVIRRKYISSITLTVCIQRKESLKMNNLRIYHKKLEKEEQIKSK